MKKLAFTLLILAVHINTYAQQNVFDIGFEGGASITQMYGNDVFRQYHKPKVGFSAGMTFQYNFLKIFSLRTQVVYEDKGSYTHVTIPDGDGGSLGYVTTRFHYNFVMMPLLLRATFGKNKLRYFINAGPMVGYLAFQYSHSKSNFMQIDDQFSTNGFKRWDWGISSGLGITYAVRSHWALSCEIRNNIGLKALNNYKIKNNGEVKTTATNLLVGIAYKIGIRK